MRIGWTPRHVSRSIRTTGDNDQTVSLTRFNHPEIGIYDMMYIYIYVHDMI